MSANGSSSSLSASPAGSNIFDVASKMRLAAAWAASPAFKQWISLSLDPSTFTVMPQVRKDLTMTSVVTLFHAIYRDSHFAVSNQVGGSGSPLIVQIVHVHLHSAYFEPDDPFPCGEILRVAFIGTNLLIGAARFRGNTVCVAYWLIILWSMATPIKLIFISVGQSNFWLRKSEQQQINLSGLSVHECSFSVQRHWNLEEGIETTEIFNSKYFSTLLHQQVDTVFRGKFVLILSIGAWLQCP